MSEINLFREHGIDHKIYNSVYAETVWNWLKSGMPVSSIVDSLKALSAKEGEKFSVTEPTVRSFKKLMEDLEVKALGKEYGVGEKSRPQFQNDLVFCELGIAEGLKRLRENRAEVSMNIVLSLMEFKRKILGDKYKGQSVTDLIDVTKQFYDLMDAVTVHCDQATYEAILEDLRKKGWAEEETSDELRVQRKAAIASIEHDLAFED